MHRRQAIEIIVSNEYKNISKEERKLIIYNAWGLDETDEDIYLLPTSLRKELLDYGEPQDDIMSPKYDALVKVACQSSYKEYTNEILAKMTTEIMKQTIAVIGENPCTYPCPCCNQKTLSIRGEYDICSHCGWEDDGNEEEDKYSNPNHMTLKQGKRNYLLYGSSIGKEKI